MAKRLILGLLAFISFTLVKAQEQGQFSGDFIMNFNAYDRDTVRGTSTTQYDHQKSSSEAWLDLNYRIHDWSFMVRFDAFNNSPLQNPQEAYTAQGIGFYQVSKSFDKFNVTAGYFYDQFGSGIVFRAFEDRTLGIDYGIQGVRVQYMPNDSFMIKAFTGQQKNRLGIYPEVMKGANAEKVWGNSEVGFITGAAILNRTLDQATINQLASDINAMPLDKRFTPMYNVYIGSLYNTLTYKSFSLYTEYAKKSKEAVEVQDNNGNVQLKNLDGDVKYAVLSYSRSGLGVNLQYKSINNFINRISPYTTLLYGLMSYLPPLSMQHSMMLPAKYSISAQPQGEQGYQGEVTYSVNKRNTITANVSYINQPSGAELYREYYIDYDRKFKNRQRLIVGIQRVEYNIEVYQFETGEPLVKTITPFAEWTLPLKARPNIDDAHPRLQPSLLFEAQYLQTRENKGDFALGSVELDLAPKYSITATDMWNVKPLTGKALHYPSLYVAYTMHQTRLSVGYAKQVAGVVCAGGVCRVMPAFSGLRVELNTNF
jgi:effector-binding domain-containing protein